MQSTASTWFCTTCGAANDVGQSVCFSCKRARPGLAQDNTTAGDAASLLQGRYHLLSQVGVGGFGEVYKALDTQSGDRVVAIKQINLRGLSPQKTIEATDTFNRELHILAPLKHPNLPRIYDHFTDPDHWYLVMEFLEGETLERFLENHQRQRIYAGAGTPGLLPLADIFALAFQLCDVLGYLHGQQPPIIFRDLKPANIMCSGSGHIYLIDFGIARHFTPGKTKDTTPLGSPGYAAPEQYGKAQTTARSDLYSLGALLHHLVTGNDPSETPFQFAPLPQLLPTSLAGTRELEALVMRMVEMDSSQRPASAREVKEELQRIASLVEESAARRIWTPPPGQPPDPEVEGALQQQVQVQIQKHRTTTRRKFLRRTMIGGGTILLGSSLVGAFYNSLLSDNGPGFGHTHHRLQDFDNFPGQEPFTNIALSPDGSMLATVTSFNSAYGGHDTSQNSVQVYLNVQGNFDTINADSPLQMPQAISALAWAPDNTRLAIGLDDGSIAIWNTSGGPLSYVLNISDGRIQSIAWSPDGTLIAVGGGMEGVIVINSIGRVVSSYSYGNSFFPGYFLSWSPDGTRIVTPYDSQDPRSSANMLQVWDVKNNQTVFSFGQLDTLQAAWSPNSSTIAALRVDGLLTLYDASNGKTITSFDMRIPIPSNIDSSQPIQLLWSPDSHYLAVDNGQPFIRVWNVTNGIVKNINTFLNVPRAMTWVSNTQISLIDSPQNAKTIDVSGL